MKKIIFLLMLLFSIIIFSEKVTTNEKNNLDKLIGYWIYSKVGFQDPVGIKKISNEKYQIGYSTWEGNFDKNGFEWNDLQIVKQGIYKIIGTNNYLHVLKNGFLIKDKSGNIVEHLDKKIDKLPY